MQATTDGNEATKKARDARFATVDSPDSRRAEPGEAPRPSRRILLVEQDRNAAVALRELLCDDGHVVSVAESGAEAVKLARDLMPDLVLCDLELRGQVSAYDVARAIRHLPSAGHCRLAALSVFSAGDCGPRAREAGFAEIVRKPIDLRLLAALIVASRPE